uniref:Proteasomal ubiquitin receptor ADRM1 homolog n=1 Tax=Parastrongyloides trichosuri TaxID=131310 RepID=A0A0N4Z6K4_PARTI
MAVMFANTRSSSEASRGVLYEFKAGRSFLEDGSSENTKKVIAEKTKGLIIIKRSSDQLTHFCWKNRECNTIVDDFIIFPGDTDFSEVTECPDGRVFMLKFKSNNDRKLYWLQEGDKTKGDEITEKVKDLLNNPQPERSSGRSGGGTGGREAGINFKNFSDTKADGNELLGALDQNQLMQLLTLMNGGSATSESVANLSSLGDKGSVDGTNKSTRSSKSSKKQPDLSTIITTKNVLDSAIANASQLTPHLPKEEPIKQDVQEIKDSLNSPAFKEAVSTIGHAIKSGQAGPILEQFGLPKESVTAASSGNLVEFAKSLSSTETTEPMSITEDDQGVKEPEAKKNRPDIDNMDVD